MKVLEIFENKLRYKNYSQNTIRVYRQTLFQYLKEINCKDPYRISTKEMADYLENKTFTSISQQNQFIGCLKLFAKHILNKKDVHLSKIERPKTEKKLPQVIDKDFLLDKISKIGNLKHKAIITNDLKRMPCSLDPLGQGGIFITNNLIYLHIKY